MPKTRAARQRVIATAPRARILAVAADRFRELGPRAFTMADVAQTAGLTTPALYRHFKGKEELLGELVVEGFDVFTRYLTRALEGKTPRERLHLISAAYFDFAADHPGYYETIFLTPDIPGLRRFPEDFEQGRSASFQLVVDRVRECIETGFLKASNPLETAFTIWAHGHGLMGLFLVGRLGTNRTQARARYDASFKRLLEGLAK
jgi:AcrR family transcriptional regulator